MDAVTLLILFLCCCQCENTIAFSAVVGQNFWQASCSVSGADAVGRLRQSPRRQKQTQRQGWVQGADGEWEWEEDDPTFAAQSPTSLATTATTMTIDTTATATPQLPSGKLKPKQSLGQNFLKDPNTVAKIVRAFHEDATTRGNRSGRPLESIVELGPGAGALTDRLVDNYGTDVLQCIEVDPRAVEILEERYPSLVVHHADVLQVNYPEMADREGHPLVVIGNLPYYITSQILFALADASHYGAVDCATVTMQWEVAQRMVAPTDCKVRSFAHHRARRAVAFHPSHCSFPLHVWWLLLWLETLSLGLWYPKRRLPDLC